jgi:hypothetical protein
VPVVEGQAAVKGEPAIATRDNTATHGHS